MYNRLGRKLLPPLTLTVQPIVPLSQPQVTLCCFHNWCNTCNNGSYTGM
jgi:hypothetical protein